MNVIVVMAKAPLPNEVKTRLIPPLTPEIASNLYQSFLLDKIEQVKSIRGVHRFIAYTPATAEVFFQKIVPLGFTLIRQTGANLGERLANISKRLFNERFKKVIILDSDTPHLPPEYIREGLSRLDSVDVVLGPCEDGGYYLIGTKSNQPFLFKEIPWSTKGVTELTVKKAQSFDLTVHLLDKWYDVDTVEDLQRLKRYLASENSKGVFICENTYHVISRMELEQEHV